jgi:N-acetylglucosamine repressor
MAQMQTRDSAGPAGSRLARGASRDLMRDLNTNLIVNLVMQAGPISRADLARQSRLSPATVSGITGRLVRAGILTEIAVGPSNGGRPPVLLILNEQAGFVIGIKLKESGLTTAVTDLGLEVRYAEDTEVDLVGDPNKAIDAIEASVSRAIQGAVSNKKVLGIGIGIPGVVDAELGICRFSHILRWRDVELRDTLRQRLKLPVWVDNDVNTLAVAEKWFGAGVGLSHFLTVTIGRGIGLGIVLNGEIYRGGIGAAGEFGHVTVADGPLCQCGNAGCLEAIASEPALMAKASLVLGRAIDRDELLALAEAGQPDIVGILSEGGRTVGRALANLITLLNPERIIVSGEGLRLGPAFFQPLVESARELAFAGLGRDTDILVQQWGDEVWAKGAATLVLRELFRPPVEHGAVSLEQELAG